MAYRHLKELPKSPADKGRTFIVFENKAGIVVMSKIVK